MTNDATHYDELGIDRSASRDELKVAYQQRIDELEAAREGKGVSEAQLQRNRAEIARVRAAWNVLADPFQRSRYDEQIGFTPADGDADADNDVEIVEDSERPGVELTGWRRWMAPPPPKQATGGAGKTRAARRPMREPTVSLPPGMRLAEPRARGMALLFDFSVVLVIYWLALLAVPGMVNSEYSTKVDQINHLNKLHDAQGSIDDATKSLKDAKTASEKKSAQKDANSAAKDFTKAATDVNKDGLPVRRSSDAIQKQADKLTQDIRGAMYAGYLTVLVLALLYLVPMTATTGRTLGMRGRRIRVVRVDGSPVGWYGAFTRFVVPILIALAIPTIGPLVGLGMVLWGYRDANGQGLHDKLARTLVVADPR